MRRISLTVICFTLSGTFSIGTQASSSTKLPVSKAPKNAQVYIVQPKDRSTVKSPVTVVFGLKNMGVAPAGVKQEHTGHHHLIIDASLPPKGQPIPADEKHIHFGKGQTETTLDLKPGTHSLQLILGDHLHIPHDPVVSSKKITITVQ